MFNLLGVYKRIHRPFTNVNTWRKISSWQNTFDILSFV